MFKISCSWLTTRDTVPQPDGESRGVTLEAQLNENASLHLL
jgi:hypothetical protein